MARSTFHLLLEPTLNYDESVSGFRVVSVSKRRPRSEGVVVKLTLTVPDAVFQPLLAEGDIVAEQVAVNVRPETVEP